jgi:putative ABC transport system permease protein
MFENYFKITLRNIAKYKGYSFINIAGLAIGMACCILILLWVKDELSYDRYHEKAERIYRLALSGNIGGSDYSTAAVAAPTVTALVNDFPEVEQATRFYVPYSQADRFIRYEDKTFKETRIAFADANSFDIFTIPLIDGSPVEALANPNSIIISDVMATKYFCDDDPLGKIISMDAIADFKVTGVFKTIPANSHFHFDFIASLSSIEESRDPWWLNNLAFRTYILLREGVDYNALEAKFPNMIKKYIAPMFKQLYGEDHEDLTEMGMRLKYSLQPLREIHLYSNLLMEFEPNGDIRYIYVFSSIALFILLIACVNFMNLSTARSANRAKEVGIRKVVGSERWQLILQFLIESTFLSLIALAIALLLVNFVIPYFNYLSGKALTFFDLTNKTIFSSLFIIMIAVGFIAGSYPAFFLSSFKPISVLKNKFFKASGSLSLRNVLVLFQFAISIILIFGTVIILQQLHYIENKKLGFNKEQVLIIHDTRTLGSKVHTFKQELLQNPQVVSVSVTGFLPVTSERLTSGMYPDGIYRENGTLIQAWLVDFDYIKTMGMETIQGRNFSTSFPSDSMAVIINEAAVKHFGWDNPIGKRIGDYTAPPNAVMQDWTVIGVVKDFHYESLRNQIGPLGLFISSSTNMVSVRLNIKDFSNTIQWITEKWQRFAQGQPFEYSFLDARFEQMYLNESKLGKIFGIFAVLAIFIGCLGLFGLTVYSAERRTKEIGIRKVVGASISELVTLLAKEYTKWVLLANLFALPIAYYAMNKWLHNFAYRINLTIWPFVFSGLAALVISLFTVSWQAIRAATVNPVEALHYE